MAFDQHLNFAASLVVGAPGQAGLSLEVTPGDGVKFATAPFNAFISPALVQPTDANAEIVRVTAISLDTLTITRAQESSTQQNILAGYQIVAGPTVKTFTDLETAIGTEATTRATADGLRALLTDARFVPAWAASTAYVANQQVIGPSAPFANQLIERIANGTSATTWASDSANWQLPGLGGSGVSISSPDSSVTIAGTATSPQLEVSAAIQAAPGNAITNHVAATNPHGDRLTPSTTVVNAAASPYSVPVGELTRVDLTTGSVTLKLANTPADETHCGWKIVAFAPGNTLTIQTQGSDVFQAAGGSTSETGQLPFQAKAYLYQHSTSIWLTHIGDTSLGQLDLRYGGAFNVKNATYGAKGDANTVYDGAITAASNQLSSTNAAFVAADKGKVAIVVGAGPTGTLSGALTAGAIATIPVSALAAAIPATAATVTGQAATTSTLLSTGAPITSLPVNALASAVPAGFITITSGAHTQTFQCSAAAAAATSITVVSQTPNFAYPSSSAVTFSQNFPITAAAQGATSLTLTAATVAVFAFPSGSTVTTPLTTTISSVAAGVATLAANATVTVSAAPVIYGTDDTVAIQAAITAAIAAFGAVYMPRGRYLLTAALVASAAIRIFGDGVTPLWQSAASGANNANLPTTAPFIAGSVLLQTAAATDAIQVTCLGRAVKLHDFGIAYADSIKFCNTGHGINGIPPTLLTYQDHGIFYGQWENLWVYGHDGNHYAYRLVNAIHMNVRQLAWAGGGGLEYFNNTQVYNYGNSILDDVGGTTFCGGSAHAHFVHALTTTGNSLGLLQYNRVGAFTTSVPGINPPATSAQKLFTYANNVGDCAFVAPDLESSVGSTALFPPFSQIMGNGDYPNPTFAPALASATAYQNTSGTAQMLRMVVNATTTGTPSSCSVAIGATNVTATTVVGTSVTASPTAGDQDTIVVPVPAGWWVEATFSGCTLLNKGGYAIPASFI